MKEDSGYTSRSLSSRDRAKMYERITPYGKDNLSTACVCGVCDCMCSCGNCIASYSSDEKEAEMGLSRSESIIESILNS